MLYCRGIFLIFKWYPMVKKIKTTASLFESYIRQYCIDKNITMQDLAKQTGLARSTFYTLLKAKSDSKISHLITIANILKIHPDLLLKLKWHEFDITKDEGAIQKTYQSKSDSLGFVEETVANGSVIVAGDSFTKAWTIKNLSNQTWEGRVLQCIDENIDVEVHYKNPTVQQLTPCQSSIYLPSIPPNRQVTIAVIYKTPHTAGHYLSKWKMLDANGQDCFPNAPLLTDVVVKRFGDFDNH